MKIEVSGTALDMGLAQGEATAGSWATMLKTMGNAAIPRGFEDMIAKYCPRQLVRMIGIARGAEVPLELVLLGSVGELLLAQFDYFIGACTAIAWMDKGSPKPAPIIGKNFDYPSAFSAVNIVRISRPQDAYASIDVTAGPSSGAHGGVNEKGLAIAYNSGCSIDKPKMLLPIGMLVQEALERFETAEEAINFITDSPRGGSALMMIADRAGDMAGLEVTPHYWGVRRPEKDRIGHTNHSQTPQTVAFDLPSNAYYSDKMPPLLRGHRIKESSELRYNRLEKLMAQAPILDIASAKTILADHGEGDMPSDNTICRHGPYYATTMSVVLYTGEPKLSVAWGNPCRNSFEEVAL